MWLGKSISVTVATASLVVSAAACFRVDDFVVTSGTPEGWVIVELSNPDCPSTIGIWHREFLVPSSGFLCSAAKPRLGYVYERYWQVDESGKRHRLVIGQDVHLRSTAGVNLNTCKVVASVFWYGDEGRISGDLTALVREKSMSCGTRGSEVSHAE